MWWLALLEQAVDLKDITSSYQMLYLFVFCSRSLKCCVHKNEDGTIECVQVEDPYMASHEEEDFEDVQPIE